MSNPPATVTTLLAAKEAAINFACPTYRMTGPGAMVGPLARRATENIEEDRRDDR